MQADVPGPLWKLCDPVVHHSTSGLCNKNGSSLTSGKAYWLAARSLSAAKAKVVAAELNKEERNERVSEQIEGEKGSRMWEGANRFGGMGLQPNLLPFLFCIVYVPGCCTSKNS